MAALLCVHPLCIRPADARIRPAHLRVKMPQRIQSRSKCTLRNAGKRSDALLFWAVTHTLCLPTSPLGSRPNHSLSHWLEQSFSSFPRNSTEPCRAKLFDFHGNNSQSLAPSGPGVNKLEHSNMARALVFTCLEGLLKGHIAGLSCWQHTASGHIRPPPVKGM